MRHTLGNVQEVAGWHILASLVGRRDQCLQPRHVVWVCEVDDIDGDVVLLEAHTNVLEIFLVAVQRMAYKNDDPLPLCLILPVLEGKLSNLDSLEAVGVSV